MNNCGLETGNAVPSIPDLKSAAGGLAVRAPFYVDFYNGVSAVPLRTQCKRVNVKWLFK